MPGYQIRFTREAIKDIDKLSPQLKMKLESILINVIASEPFSGKKLIGDLTGLYSYRLSHKDRIVFHIDPVTLSHPPALPPSRSHAFTPSPAFIVDFKV